MRYSKLFGKTIRRSKRQEMIPVHSLLVRAGYVRSLGSGLYALLPLGQRVARKIMDIIREELDVLDGQEVSLPLVSHRELWARSGRDSLIGEEMARFRDRDGRKMVLSPSHEEAMVELVRMALSSIKDLPLLLYQFQLKFRDEKKPKGGLIRAKEFLMKDAYSFHKSYTELNNFFPKIFRAYLSIFRRCGIEVFAAESGVGYMGGEKAYEFMTPSKNGEDWCVHCPNCGYMANRNIARGIKEYGAGTPLPMEIVDSGAMKSMPALAAALDLPLEGLAKAMVFKTYGGFVMGVVRADYSVSLEKLSVVLGEPVLRLATSEELKSFDLIPGFLSPLPPFDPSRMPLIVDEVAVNTPNLVFGANKDGRHFLNVNFGRDYESPRVADISRVKQGDSCISCGRELEEIRSLELGNIFKLGDFYTRALDYTLPDQTSAFPMMGSYGIGIGRLIAAVVEAHSDDRGIRWPREIAPFDVHLIGIGRSLTVQRETESIYEELGPTGVLWDDRKESAGVQLKDSDLLGIPIRVVVSQRHILDGKIECTWRNTGETVIVDRANIKDVIKAKLGDAGASHAT